MKLLFIYIGKYKFLILFILFSLIILFFQSGLHFFPILSLLSIILIINLLSKSNYPFPFLIILALLLSMDAFMAFVYNSRMSIGAMASIFETNKHEILGMSGIILSVGIPIFALNLFLLLKAKNELKQASFSVRLSVIFQIVFLLFIPFYFFIKVESRWKDIGLSRDYMKNPDITFQNYVMAYYPLVYGNIATIAAYQYEMYKMKNYAEENRELPLGIYLKDTSSSPQKVYLIMGESASRRHFSLYGYPLETTPFIDSLYRSDSAQVRFYSGISPASITRDAIRLSLSFSTPENGTPFFRNKNLIELAHDAGYKTFWISNQEKVGIHDTYAGFISNTSDYTYFSKNEKKDDLNLIPYIKENEENDEKQFFFIHLHGSHYPYDYYDDSDRILTEEKNINREDEYDMTIHHTDKVISEVYKMAWQDSSSVIVYISDHGEIIGKGHGHIGQGIDQFEVPLVGINNSSLCLEDIIMKYYDTEFNMVNTSNTIYIVAEILGYKVCKKNAEQAIEEGRFIYHVDGRSYPISIIEEEKLN